MTDRTGRCLCGAVALCTVRDATDAFGACHCSMCQRISGGVNLSFHAAAASIEIAGATAVVTYRSSDAANPVVLRHLRVEPLVSRHRARGEAPQDYSVGFGLLDDKSGMRLAGEICIDTKPEAYALGRRAPPQDRRGGAGMTDRTGKCLCGAVSYVVTDGRDDFGICHCKMCQRWTGAMFPGIVYRAEQVAVVGSSNVAELPVVGWRHPVVLHASADRRCGSSGHRADEESAYYRDRGRHAGPDRGAAPDPRGLRRPQARSLGAGRRPCPRHRGGLLPQGGGAREGGCVIEGHCLCGAVTVRVDGRA